MRRIRQNQWDNWYGYEGTRRVEAFFNDSEHTAEQNARAWLAADTAPITGATGGSMTKQEAMTLGTQQGHEAATKLPEEGIRKDRGLVLSCLKAIADTGLLNAHITGQFAKDAYRDAFWSAYMREWDRRFSELPEVKAERRFRIVESKLESMIRYADDELAKFKAQLDQDARYAFEWAQNAIRAAADRHVAAVLMAVLKAQPSDQVPAECVGVDATIAEARKEALRGARYPSQSTSTVHNLTQLYVTAAYAQFVDDTERL